MTSIGRNFACALLTLPFLTGAASAQEKSLYQRLGGYDAIAAVTDDFLTRLGADPQLKKFFVGLSAGSKNRVRQHAVDLICQQTGGPCIYIGRDMKAAHQGMGITKAEWDHTVRLFVDSLNKFKVPEREQKEIAGIVGPLEKDIVEK
jgi:hemoglobin